MKRQLISMVLPVLLAGCGSVLQNANVGPEPGGGFDCPNNAYQGCANLEPGSASLPPLVSKAQNEH